LLDKGNYHEDTQLKIDDLITAEMVETASLIGVLSSLGLFLTCTLCGNKLTGSASKGRIILLKI
jgi:hypothetical protein